MQCEEFKAYVYIGKSMCFGCKTKTCFYIDVFITFIATISYKNHGVSGSDNPTDTNLVLHVIQAV